MSYLGALRMQGDCRDVLEQGYRKACVAPSLGFRRVHSLDVPLQYPESAFKIPLLDKWMIVVAGRNMVEEFGKHGDDALSSPAGSREVRRLRVFLRRAMDKVLRSVPQALQSQYTFEPPLITDKYHAEVVKEKLTRRLPTLLPGVIDEVVVSVKEHIIARGNGIVMRCP